MAACKIYIACILIAELLYIAATLLLKERPTLKTRAFPWLLLAALMLRVVLGAKLFGFAGDYQCWFDWATAVYEKGFKNFYDICQRANYPPGYIYVLYIAGALMKVCGAEYMSHASNLILKLPAILCDIAAGLMLYKLARKKRSERAAEYIAALYIFNPTVIFDSTVWGQVDGVLSFAVLIMCMLLSEKENIPAYFAFGIGTIIKPQMLIFAPVLIYGIIENVILKNFSWRRFWLNLACGLLAIGMMALLCVPFGGPLKIISLYESRMSVYPAASVGAYNFWTLLGKYYAPQDEMLLFMTFRSWGTLSIIVTIALSAWYFFKTGDRDGRYYTAAALLNICVFLFAVSMRERYMFPALLMLAATCAVSQIKSTFGFFIAFSAVHLYNVADVFLEGRYSYVKNDAALRIVSAATVLIGCGYVYSLFRSCSKSGRLKADNK